MTAPQRTVIPPDQPLWRVGRSDRPWCFPDFRYAMGRFPSRWDDPEGTYRVLYAATTRIGAFVESLRDFRVAPGLQAKLNAIGAPDALPPGVVPRAWLEKRYIGNAIVKGAFADVQHHEWITYFQAELAPRFAEWGVPEIDGAVLRSTITRAVTMAASRLVYEASLADAADTPRFTGIRYESRFGNDIECWAIFEYSQVNEMAFSHISAEAIRLDDEDLLAACQVLGIRIEDPPPAARLSAGDAPTHQWWKQNP